MKIFDVVVVGSGHAGVEASYSSARKGASVLLVTMDLSRTAYMSCNPSIGGLGKGHIVKEIDVLGGLMGRAADSACIQFKLLNRSKGPAVRGSRAQCDKSLYSTFVRNYLEKQENISFLSGEVKSLLFKKDCCVGVVTDKGDKIGARAVVLTTGTFMKGIMHIGSQKQVGGRAGEKSSTGLSDQLKSLGFPVYRLKTGTPPRLKKESIDFSALIPQSGDKEFRPFSFFTKELKLPQVKCYLTYTNEKTHEIIRKNLKFSALYSGAIEGQGPRYCPSVEDKIIRFAEKTKHQSFLEPETLGGSSIYLQGLSTSLPAPIQLEFLRTIKGLEQVEILRPGYAVEYDFLCPLELYPTLETKKFKNLFFAGQINGTSGYEEAAGQGLVAGVNSANKVKGHPPLVLKRHTAYIGVLIDDLVTKGTKEPYRMLTSRAEHRLILREDNALERLFGFSVEQGLLSAEKQKVLKQEIEQRKHLLNFLEKTQIVPDKGTNEQLKNLKVPTLNQPQTLKKFFCRPEMSFQKMKSFLLIKKEVERKIKQSKENNTKRVLENKEFLIKDISDRAFEAVEIKVKYEGYIVRQEQFIEQSQKWENTVLPPLDYDRVKGLSLEALEKLKKIRPQTLAQAGRISGIPPSAIQALRIHLKLISKGK